MVTRIRRGAKAHVYLREHRKAVNLKAEAMAERLGIERESYYRLERNPKTLSAEEILELADALGFADEPGKLFRPPETTDRPSIDAITEDMPDEDRAVVVDLARNMRKRAGR